VPELPEAEYMVRRLVEYAPAVSIRRVRELRPGVADARVVRYARGAVAAYGRRAKNVLLHLANGWTVRVQLGMTGHFYWVPRHQEPPRFTRVMFELAGGAGLAFEDSRVFGGIEVHKTSTLDSVFAAYGPEPLDAAYTWRDLAAKAGTRRAPIKPLLLDQGIVAGLGNIWVAEALFRARVHPARAASTLSDAEWRRLHAAIRHVLERAIENTLRVTKAPDEFPSADLLSAAVYGREGEPCRRCRASVSRVVQAGRSTFFCAACQEA